MTQLELDRPDWAPWMDNNWKYRRKINISNDGASGLSDYQVWIPITEFGSDWSDISSKAQGDMDDFRFTMSTATTTIPYWIDPNTTNPEGFWVRVTTIPTSGTSIFMYYGNSSAGSASDETATFEIFDDFDDNSIDYSIWTTHVGHGGTVSEIGGEFIHGGDSDWHGANHYTVKTFNKSDKLIIDFWVRRTGAYGGGGTHIRMCFFNTGSVSWGSTYDSPTPAAKIDFGGGNNVTFDTQWRITLYGDGTYTLVRLAGDAYISDVTTPAVIADSSTITDGFVIDFEDSTYQAHNIYFDDTIVRKYADSAPTISSVGNEEAKYYLTGNYRANVLNSGAVDTKVHQVDWNPSSQAAETDVNIYARASNSSFAAGDGTPSWTSVSNGGNPAVVGRYIQWMSTFTTTSSTTTPKIEDITLTYTSPPTAPTGCANTYASDTQIDVSWTDNSSGQYAEDYFKIEKSTDGGTYGQIDTDTASPYADTTTSANKKYQYQVRAYNTAGNSAYSTAASPVYTTPAAPAIGTAATDSSSQITWNWTDNSAWEDGFKIYCATSTELRNTAGAGVQTWAEGSLTPNTTYQRYVKSYKGSLYSAASGTAEKVTLCNSPINMTIASPAETQLELNWDANGNPDGTKYIAHCSPDGFATVYSSTVTATTATFSSLTRNTEYEVRVYAVNHAEVCTGYLGQYSRRTQPGTFQEKITTRTGKNSYGFEGDGIWTWQVPANGGSAVTIMAYAQYNSDYGGAAKPKITLSNMGVNSSDQMTGGADTWEKLTVSGTPSGKGVLFLKVEGFSTAVDAKYFVDDIQISQP